MLELDSVSVARGRRLLVRDATLSFGPGQVHALLGHNGAGKTTLFRAVAGLVPIRSGRVSTSAEPSVLFVGSQFPAELRVRDLLTYRARTVSASARTVAHVRRVTGVDAFEPARCGELSTGMAQRVALALALLGGARTLLLDEPTTGLDPQAIDSLLALLRDLRADGCTVVLCSHDLARLELVCDTVTCLRSGRVTATGTVTEMASRVPRAGHVVRTSDDEAAMVALRHAGVDAGRTSRGLLVAGCVPLSQVWAALAGHAELREVTVDRSLFDRIFDEFASAPAPSHRRGRRS
ncbi:ATP-binding cassette domain-containing protein [Cellulomonas hominis]